MKEVRNPDGRLVCCINEIIGRIEILEKGWITVIQYNHDGNMDIMHFRKINI